MELDTAHLSSLSSSLDDLTQRISAMADGHQGSTRQDVAADLFEVERLLQAASRRLHALLARR